MPTAVLRRKGRVYEFSWNNSLNTFKRYCSADLNRTCNHSLWISQRFQKAVCSLCWHCMIKEPCFLVTYQRTSIPEKLLWEMMSSWNKVAMNVLVSPTSLLFSVTLGIDGMDWTCLCCSNSWLFKKTNKWKGKRKKITAVRAITDVRRMEEFISHWALAGKVDKIHSVCAWRHWESWGQVLVGLCCVC